MAEAATTTPTPTLSEHYLLKENEAKTDVHSKPEEVKEDVKPESADVSAEKAEEPPAAAVEEKTEDTAVADAEEKTESNPSAENSSEDAPAADTESSETAEEKTSDEQEAAADETPEIKLETAPADYRFPTTNQTRHCFTRYIEYHRCVAAKGDDAPECDKFAKYYRALCPSEWVERWNEQRENGTFPGPL